MIVIFSVKRYLKHMVLETGEKAGTHVVGVFFVLKVLHMRAG